MVYVWNEESERLLKSQYTKGASYRQLSLILNADIFTIQNKVKSLGLLRKWEAQTAGKRVGHLDIEASQLNASFGFMICWCIKEDGKEIISDKLVAKDFKQKDKLHTDRRIVESMVNSLNEFDVITHFFGDYFDVPFVRSRCLKHGLRFPEYGSVNTIDVWKWCKRNLKLHSHRLEAVAEHLGVSSKTKLDPNTWVRGTMGDLDAIAEIYEHNRQDVVTLEKVFHILEPYSSGAKRSI